MQHLDTDPELVEKIMRQNPDLLDEWREKSAQGRLLLISIRTVNQLFGLHETRVVKISECDTPDCEGHKIEFSKVLGRGITQRGSVKRAVKALGYSEFDFVEDGEF